MDFYCRREVAVEILAYELDHLPVDKLEEILKELCDTEYRSYHITHDTRGYSHTINSLEEYK